MRKYMTFLHIRFISFKKMRPDGKQAGILWGWSKTAT